jgi:chitodextrinase
VNVTLPDTQAPAAPAGLSYSNLTETGFTLSWSVAVDNVGVTGYNIYQNGLYLTSVTGTSASITGLSPSTIYGMTVTARDAAGNYSIPSVIFNVTTPDTHAPSAPTDLNASNITQTSFTLSWTASSDNIGVVGYEVYRNGVFETNVSNPTFGISGLTANTTYAMTVRARDAAGNLSSASSSLNVTTQASVIPDSQAPSAPTGLSSGNITQTSFLLSWTASTDNIGVTGYDVYRNGTFVETVSGTSASISGLSPGTTYTMSLRAKDAAGNISVPSSGFDVTTLTGVVPDTQAPSVPSGLNATGITQTSFTLNWTASTDNIEVAGYDVYLNGLLNSSVMATSSEITGLTGSTTYAVAVRARDAADNTSNLSAALDVTTLAVVTPDTEAPSVPSGLASSNITEAGFTLTWDASTDNIGVSGYEVLSNGTVIRTVGSNAVTLTDLNASTTYNMTVRAKDAAGNTSAPSAVLPVRTSDIILPDTQAPTVPNGLNSFSVTETGFTLTWNPSTDDVGVTGYDVYLNGGLLNTVTVTSISLTGLSAGTVYTMTVRARDAANNVSAASNANNVRTADNHAPTAPSGLSRSSLTQSSFTLNWTASTDNVGVVGYDVYRNGVFYTSVTGVSSSITGLSASMLYSMTVRARDAAGNVSASSPVLDVTTPDTQPPTVPTGLTSSNISQSSFTLSWSASADNVRVTSYDVYMNGTLVNSVTGTTVGITGLAPYTTYAMTVRAKDAAENVSNASIVLNVTTLDITPPSVPSNLSASSLTQSGFRLTWTASTDNVGVTGYYVYQDGVQIALVATNSANVTGLNASTRYVMTVRARDAAGNTSAASTSLTVLTPDTQAPNAPSGLNASNLTQTSFTLTWNPSTDNVAVTGYNIYRDGTLVTSVTGTAAGISGLAVARTYVMTVRAKDAANNLSVSSTALNVTTPDTEGPTAPGNLVYSNLTQSGFTLNWTASIDNVGVTRYNIYDHGTLLRSVTGTAATLTGLAASRTYEITVRAVDAAGNLSDPSSLVRITTPDTEAPTIPSGLHYTSLTQSGFNLVWNACTDNVGVTEYEVYQDGIFLNRTEMTTVVVSGLRAARTYVMTVRARDAAGNYSAFSTAINVTTPDTEAPAVPVELESVSITETQFILKWRASTDNVGVSAYEIYKDGVLFSQVTDTFATITGLTAFRQYYMTVRAKDAAGNISARSELLAVKTLDLHAPTTARNLSISQLTDSSFTLSWSPSEDNVGVAFYEIRLNTSMAGTTADTIIDLTGLRASTLYALTVIAVDSAGNESESSTALSVTTPDTRAPNKPADLISEDVTSSSFLLKWCSSWDNVGVIQYEIFRNDSLISQVADTMVRVSGLIFNTTYQMRVRARDAAGNISGYSETLEVTTDFPGEPGTITVFPNPCTDYTFFVDLGRDYTGEVAVELLDQGGRIQFTTAVAATSRLIEVSGFELPSGLYLIRIFYGGSVYSQKVLIDNL